MSHAVVGAGLIGYSALLASAIALRFRHGVNIGGPFNMLMVSRKDEPVRFWLEIGPAMALDLFAAAAGLFLLIDAAVR